MIPSSHMAQYKKNLVFYIYIYRWVVTSYIYFVTFIWVNLILTQVNFLWNNCTFILLLWATLLSLLYLNAIQVKNASIYSKRAVYFSLGNERCLFENDSLFWVNSFQRLVYTQPPTHPLTHTPTHTHTHTHPPTHTHPHTHTTYILSINLNKNMIEIQYMIQSN